MTRLWIRADGSAGVGLGHVMRTLALAEAATASGLRTTMLVENGPAATLAAARGADVGQPRSDWPGDVTRGDIVVLDGYGFGQPDIDAVARVGAVVALMDDLGTRDLAVDVVINQNPVPRDTYDRARRSLLGPRYALVRAEFVDRRRRRGDRLDAMVITLGGGAVPPVTLDVLAALDAIGPTFTVRLVLGPASDSPLPSLPPWLEVVAAPNDIAAALDADAAIAAAGSTTWELLAMGVPTLLIQTAENQAHVIRGAAEANAALSAGPDDGGVPSRLELGLRALLDAPVRADLSAAALDLVDGRGSDRVLAGVLGLRDS